MKIFLTLLRKFIDATGTFLDIFSNHYNARESFFGKNVKHR